jgi:hypothetical protein
MSLAISSGTPTIPPRTDHTQENQMAAKKPGFPSRPCPKCGKPIHIKSKKHEACGWGMESNVETPTAVIEQPGNAKPQNVQPAPTSSRASISMDDIQAVNALVNKLGAETVRQLADVLDK